MLVLAAMSWSSTGLVRGATDVGGSSSGLNLLLLAGIGAVFIACVFGPMRGWIRPRPESRPTAFLALIPEALLAVLVGVVLFDAAGGAYVKKDTVGQSVAAYLAVFLWVGAAIAIAVGVIGSLIAGASVTVARRTAHSGWYPDPSGRYTSRWWDGKRWRAWVDGTRNLKDPLGHDESLPAAAPAPP